MMGGIAHPLCGLQAVQSRGEVWVSLCFLGQCQQGRIPM